MKHSFSKIPPSVANKCCPTAPECIKAEDGKCTFWDAMHHYECKIHIEHERNKFRNQVLNGKKEEKS